MSTFIWIPKTMLGKHITHRCTHYVIDCLCHICSSYQAFKSPSFLQTLQGVLGMYTSRLSKSNAHRQKSDILAQTGRKIEVWYSADHIVTCYMELSQKISLQEICFGPFIFSSNKNIAHFIVLLSCQNWGIFYYLVTSFHVLCYQPSSHNCLHLAIIFKFLAAELLLQY